MRSLDQKLADLNVNRSAEEGDPSLSTAAADTAAGPADGDGRTSEPSTSSVQSVHQQHREEEGEEESKQAAYERMQVSVLKQLCPIAFVTYAAVMLLATHVTWPQAKAACPVS